MIEFTDTHDDSFIHIEITNRITKDDINLVVPKLEHMLKEYGMIRAIVILKGFKGYTFAGLVEDFKFFLAHWNECCQMAIVGDSDVEKFYAAASSFMNYGEVRYYDVIHLYKAMEWMQEESPLKAKK